MKTRAEKRRKDAEEYQKSIQSWNGIGIGKYKVDIFMKGHVSRFEFHISN